MNKETAKELTIKAARFLDDKKAEDIKLYDLMGLSSLCDYILIATSLGATHLNALEQEVSTELKKDGVYKTNRDGGESGNWRISDYGNFMLHIMTREARDFYALDKIFSFGKAVKWEKTAVKAPSKKTAAKAAPKKEAAKKTTAKKTAAKKTAVKKTTAKKTAVKKTTVKKTAVKKPSPKKAAVKKPAAKAAVKKAAVKKTPVKAAKKIVKKVKK